VPQTNVLNVTWRNWLQTDSTVYGYKVKEITINGDTTTRNGGLNTAHPYLSGVSIPMYVGANDDDSIWVENVLNLTNLSTGYVEQKIPVRIISQPQNVTTYSGLSASFTVTATGSGTLSYQWYDDGIAVDSATSATWSFVADTSQDGSNVYCVVSNDTLPNDTSNIVMLSVSEVTTPILQQASDTLILVVSSMFGGVTYQWYQNTVALSGKTDSTLTIIADSAFYSSKKVIYCMVTNGAGSVNSIEWIFQASSTTGSRWDAYKSAFKSAYKRAWK
jgi:hypothetical protein